MQDEIRNTTHHVILHARACMCALEDIWGAQVDVGVIIRRMKSTKCLQTFPGDNRITDFNCRLSKLGKFL